MNKEDKSYSLVLASIYVLFFLIIFSSTESLSSAQSNSLAEYAYVPNIETNTVSVINTTTNTVTATLPVGTIPNGVAINQDGSKVYVTSTGNDEDPGRRFSIIYTDTYEVVPKLVGEGYGYKPLGIAITPDETLYIASSVTEKVYAINQTALKTTPISVGIRPLGLAITLDGKWVYVANQGSGTVSVINTTTNNVTITVPVGSEPYEVAVDPNGECVYVTNEGSGTVSVINTTTNNVTATVPVGIHPTGVVVTPDSKKVYVANHNSYKGTVSVINTTTLKVTPIDIQGVNLCGVAVTHNGDFVYVTATGSKNVSGGVFVINTTTDIPKKVLGGSGQTGLGQFIGPVPGSKLETKTTLSFSPNQSLTSEISKSMTLTAAVSVSSKGAEELTGKVIFMDECAPIGNGSDVNLVGQAILDTSSLPNGSHSIIARYSGNDIFRPSTSPFLTIKVPEKNSSGKIIGIIATFIVLITAIINFITAYVNKARK
jgi:YVTN family beta-propeller protein